jgi:hypothetical protein
MTRAASSRDLRDVAWWVLVGAAAGAIAGLVVGGVGGRLAMLLLRLTSPDLVIGAISDDGFEIGVITPATLNLVAAMGAVGGVNGVLYAAVRRAIPARLRLPLWSLFAAAVGGAEFVHEDGLDFTLLEPAWLAVALFVALPGAAAALVVVLVERWVDREPFASRRLATGLVLAALCGTIAVVVALVVSGAALVARVLGAGRVVHRVAQVLVPVGLVVATAVAAVSLVGTITRIV